jgi:hypothetical protein
MSEGNGYISLEQLTTARPVPERDVEVPGFGKVRIRGFSVRQRSAFERSVDGKSRDEIRERLLIATVIKPEGLTAAHLKLLGDQDGTLVEPIVEAASELTGLSAKDMKSLEKKDAPDSSETSDSGSTSS